MEWNKIKIIGAKEHNLKNISIEIPKNKLIVITGLSGSGKSTLAMDVLYNEGQRRYIDSLPSYARQFLGNIKKPEVEEITGLCPSIAIDQKTTTTNIRSTVGTVTEIYDYLRILYANVASVRCHKCNNSVSATNPIEIANAILLKYINKDIVISIPISVHQKGEFREKIKKYIDKGFTRFLINKKREILRNEEDIEALHLRKTNSYSIDVILKSIHISKEDYAEIEDTLKTAYILTEGLYCKVIEEEREELYSFSLFCSVCYIGYKELDPRMFSFNSPLGACETCKGIGIKANYTVDTEKIIDIDNDFGLMKPCGECNGNRLNKFVSAAHIFEIKISDLLLKDLKECLFTIDYIEKKLSPYQRKINERLVLEIKKRLEFLINVGLSYINLARSSRTLSGGESQRIRLATQIGSGLSGVLYVLDEPSIGLHQSDNDRLIQTLKKLRDLGNTVLVVEHDSDTMKHSDYIIDMGPFAGIHGGEIIFFGTYKELLKDKKSLTGRYLRHELTLKRISNIRIPTSFLTLKNCAKNNLKNITVDIPLGILTAISGISGSGKSTLVFEELYPKAMYALDAYKMFIRNSTNPQLKKEYENIKKNIEGVDKLKNIVMIDQKAIGRTPRSNVATYLGFFDYIRSLYASLDESSIRGYTQGTFSFNVGNGRCKECRGQGIVTIAMYLLPDIEVKCDLCKGSGYSPSVLEIMYNQKNIYDILQMTVLEAASFFKNHSISRKLNVLVDVGMDYITLGQSALTFSGGEAQRIKLAEELSKRGESTLYILDEPTTGLHFEDIRKLLVVFDKLIEKGNSVLVIEHNLEVLAYADYIIDIGPDGGKYGGEVVAIGTPLEISKNKKSKTGIYLKEML